MPNQEINFSEILVGTIDQMIQKIAQGVAKAQNSLDAAAIESQKTIQKDFPELANIGYQVSWYQMPEVEVELKVAAHYEAVEGNGSQTGFFISPFNAKYKNAFSYSADGASTFKLRIVPIPPPVFKGTE